MTVKELLIKFQEYQLEYNVLNLNCAHNAAANLFMERNQIENCIIHDVVVPKGTYCECTDEPMRLAMSLTKCASCQKIVED